MVGCDGYPALFAQLRYRLSGTAQIRDPGGNGRSRLAQNRCPRFQHSQDDTLGKKEEYFSHARDAVLSGDSDHCEFD